jgi:hypothetical protein
MLDKATLKASIIAAFAAARANVADPVVAADDFADALANAIDVYVKSGGIAYNVGLIAPPAGGPVTGPGPAISIGNLI